MSLTKSESARINGAKSHGPITIEGRARSSQNALKHGLTARDVVLASEDRAKYAEYRQMYIDQFQPSTDFQLDLIEQLAGIAWRVRRAESIETASLDREIDRATPLVREAVENPDPQIAWAAAFHALTGESASLCNLDRHQYRLTRQFEKVFRLWKETMQSEPTCGHQSLPIAA